MMNLDDIQIKVRKEGAAMFEGRVEAKCVFNQCLWLKMNDRKNGIGGSRFSQSK